MKPLLLREAPAIRQMRPSDIEALASIVEAAHGGAVAAPERYRRGVISDRLHFSSADPSCFALVADIGGTPVGLGLLTGVEWASAFWAMTLGAVHPDFQGRGIGERLIEARLSIAQARGAGMVAVSTHAPRRIERHGFDVVEINPVSGASFLVRSFKRDLGADVALAEGKFLLMARDDQ